MSTLSQIAYSGVRASQVALNTTAQNIANTNTPGYSRLQTVNGSLAGLGGLSIGGGVEVTSIRRIADSFANQQLWRATTEQYGYSSSQQYLTALETLMSGDGSSISTGLDQFFAALSEASATPESYALRQQILSEAGNLAQRFNNLVNNIDAQVDALQEQRSSMVTEVNGLTSNIALLNKQIVETEAVDGDSTSLRDHRESLVTQLSQYTGLRVNEAGDGSLTIALTNGQPLVAGSTAGQLVIEQTNSGEQQIKLAFSNTSFTLRQDGFGGSLGGLYSVEYGSLRPNLDALHEMASGLAQMVNDTLATGYDLDGNAGQPLFSYNASSSTAMLSLSAISANQLALSSVAGESGNNDVLLDLLELKNNTISLNGNSATLNDAYAGLLAQVASDSRQNQSDLTSATVVTSQAQANRDNISAVNRDEEAVYLIEYQQAYQANMKVISTANQLFEDMLAAF